jgi:hypothetical protein
MPTYTLKNIKTGVVEDRIMSCAAKEALVEQGEFKQIHTSMAGVISMHGSTLGATSGDWKDLLKATKRGSGRGNTVNV